MPLFNPTLSSSGTAAVPLAVANGDTFSIATNTQVVCANQLVTLAGGILLTVGNGTLTYVN